VCCLNGAAAWKGKTGDLLIVMAWAQVPVEEASQFKPKVIVLGKGNKIVSQASSVTWPEQV
jgi:aspartate 1-decarboxylase